MLKQIKFFFFIIICFFLSNCGSSNKNVIIPIPVSVNDKLIEKMNFKEAKEAYDYYKAIDNIDLALKAGARMLTVDSIEGVDKEIIRITTLELARNYLKQGSLELARKYAKDYIEKYPGSEELKEAEYISLKTNYLSINNPYRDQSKTRATIEIAKKILKDSKEDDAFKHEIEEILKNCYKQLFESEIIVINCYLARYNYSKHEPSLQAAYKRVAYIKEKIPAIYQDEAKLLKVEIDLAQAENKQDLVAQKKEELISKYPEYAGFFDNIKKIAMKI